MTRLHLPPEGHRVDRVGWLRAAVLGANDGIVSTASLILGVAAAGAQRDAILTAGAAGLVAGPMSMAAGEYVSVSSQADAENADLHRESLELAHDPVAEHEELTRIYEDRGLDRETAALAASKLMAKDPLGAHARDELGILEVTAARPIQAAFASALTFTSGSALPLAIVLFAPIAMLAPIEGGASLLFLALLGLVGAVAGGARPWRAVGRVTFWGAFAMLLTAGVGRLVSTAI